MTRRTAISLASAFCFAPGDKWISVAGPMKNRAGRTYPPHVLRQIQAALVPGTKCFAQPDAETYPTLTDLLGIVSQSRMLGDIVEIQINWLTGKRPQEMAHACPWGRASLNEDGVIGDDYEFEALAVSPLGSYFHEATPV